MPTVFVFSKLRPGADPDKYEKWVREYDYPNAAKSKSVIHYRAYKVTEALEGHPEYSYVEHIEITDVDDYKKDLSTPEFKELMRQWSTYIGEAKIVITKVVE